MTSCYHYPVTRGPQLSNTYKQGLRGTGGKDNCFFSCILRRFVRFYTNFTARKIRVICLFEFCAFFLRWNWYKNITITLSNFFWASFSFQMTTDSTIVLVSLVKMTKSALTVSMRTVAMVRKKITQYLYKKRSR